MHILTLHRDGGFEVAAVFITLLLIFNTCMPSGIVAQDSTTSSKVADSHMADLLSIPVENADGTTATLAKYRGKSILVVNTASECGFTPQYADLEKLYQLYKDRGFIIVAFPSNDFGAQEPGSNAEIQEFCSSRYKVSFPVMGKVSVTSPNWCPLYAALLEGAGPNKGQPAWNFEKLLINSEGTYVRRFSSKVSPVSPEMINAVEDALPKSGG